MSYYKQILVLTSTYATAFNYSLLCLNICDISTHSYTYMHKYTHTRVNLKTVQISNKRTETVLMVHWASIPISSNLGTEIKLLDILLAWSDSRAATIHSYGHYPSFMTHISDMLGASTKCESGSKGIERLYKLIMKLWWNLIDDG